MSSSLASNRLSWFYNLKGPSLTLDTACSSSLTALHLACQSIRTGEAEMSVVGGANLMFGPDMSILLGAAKILSAEGKSKMWDANANGFARGEGLGITILKVCALRSCHFSDVRVSTDGWRHVASRRSTSRWRYHPSCRAGHGYQ